MNSHPRLSVNALSSFSWNFEQDLALWRTLGIRHAGLLISKIADDRKGKLARLLAAGIRPSTVVCGSFALDAPQSWAQTRAELHETIDAVAGIEGCSVYFTPGRTTGAPWREVAEVFGEAVGPSVQYAQSRGVRLAIEPSLRTDASFINTLRDAVDVARQTSLGLIVDFANCWMERDLRETLLRAGPSITLVQIDDVVIGSRGKPGPGGRVHIGDGELPLRRLMRDVLDAGYAGVFDLEVLGPAIETEGYASALTRGVERASALLESELRQR